MCNYSSLAGFFLLHERIAAEILNSVFPPSLGSLAPVKAFEFRAGKRRRGGVGKGHREVEPCLLSSLPSFLHYSYARASAAI